MSKIAVLVPQPFRGELLRTAKDLALMLHETAAGRCEPQEIVFGYTPGEIDPHCDLDELIDQGVSCREVTFKIFDREQARAIAHLAQADKVLRHERYLLPSDGANDFLDCDAWLFVSDKVSLPVLPLRPYGFFVFDCAARYLPEVLGPAGFTEFEAGVVPNLRGADFVVATSPQVTSDLNSFVGVPRAKLHLLPMFFHGPELAPGATPLLADDYFLWITDTSPVGNHERVLRALKLYYEELGGRLKAVIAGPSTDGFRPRQKSISPATDPEYAARVQSAIRNSPCLSSNLHLAGDLPASQSLTALAHAKFIVQPGLTATALGSIIDAACLRVPAMCSRNPTTAYMDERFGLALALFDPFSVRGIANSLKRLEETHASVALPGPDVLKRCSLAEAGSALYDIVMSHLGSLHVC